MMDRLRPALIDFAARRNEILGIFLFGSHAQGRARPSSDIDVAVYVEPSAIAGDGLNLKLSYIVDLEKELDRRVDLVVLNEAPPLLRHQVFRKGEIVFERDRARVRRFIGESLVEFYDEIVSIEAAQQTIVRRHLLGR